jgi:hypothetical protein
MNENIARFCLKRPQNRFSKKKRFWSVFTKPPANLFLGPNELCGMFRGKIFTDENITRFCLKQPRNCFSKKHVSCLFL